MSDYRQHNNSSSQKKTPTTEEHAWEPPTGASPSTTQMVQLRQASGITGERVIQMLAQHKTNRPSSALASAVQMAPGIAPQQASEAVHAAAAHGIQGAGGALPHLDAIQHSFGRHDVTGVQSHVGGAAAEATKAMGAKAYATENHTAFGEAPDLHTAAHEAAHIVQQRGGVSLKGGVGQVGDIYEQHADAVADLVVQGKSAEALLDKMASHGSSTTVQRKAIQLVTTMVTNFGEFSMDKYKPMIVKGSGKKTGMLTTISFMPNEKVNATKIALTQAVISMDKGEVYTVDKQGPRKRVTEGDAKGWMIDRAKDDINPVYGADTPESDKISDTAMSNAPEGQKPVVGISYNDIEDDKNDKNIKYNATYRLGYRTNDLGAQSAQMADTPQLPDRGANAGQEFETTAMAIEGPDAEKGSPYYGSIRWGWRTDAQGTFTPIDVTLASAGDPSKVFMQAAERWNTTVYPSNQLDQEEKIEQFTTNSEVAATNVANNKTMKLRSKNKINISPVTQTSDSRLEAELIGSVSVSEGGSYWIVSIDPKEIEHIEEYTGIVGKNVNAQLNGELIQIHAGSILSVEEGKAEGRPRKALLENGVVSGLKIHHRKIWLEGKKTINLPIPSKAADEKSASTPQSKPTPQSRPTPQRRFSLNSQDSFIEQDGYEHNTSEVDENLEEINLSELLSGIDFGGED